MLQLAEELKKNPFLKLVIPFILGIIFQLNFSISWQFSLLLFLTGFGLLISLSLFSVKRFYNYIFYWGFAFNLFLFFLGSFTTSINIASLETQKKIIKSHEFIVKINEIPIIKENKLRTTVKIIAYRSEGTWKSVNCICNFYEHSNCGIEDFKVGDIMLVNSEMQEIDHPVSPYQFNYKKYLYYKSILFQLSVKPDSYIKLHLNNWNFYDILLKFRQFLLKKFDNPKMGRREKAVLSSMVLGFTGNIDPELRSSYAVAGAMHILSVSGMHIGIVYCFLMYLFFFMDKTQKLRIIRSLIIITLLWMYALILGFSPKIIRSATMFSFFAVGQSINRNRSKFNILAASTFFTLLCNPFQITELGFQLSYVAMAGIILFYKKIYELWKPATKITNNIWQLIAVSFAAQLGILPISLYYFHQFPTYFVLTNLIIMPIVGYIIYTGLALLIFSFLPFAVSTISWLLNYMLITLNWLVIHVEYLPFACIRNIYADLYIAILLSVLIYAFAGLLYNRNKVFIYIILICCLALVSLKVYRSITNDTQKLLIVHNTPKQPAISIINKHDWLLLADSATSCTVNKASENMKLNLNLKKQYPLYLSRIGRNTFICQTSIHLFAGKNLFILIMDKRIVLLNDDKLFNYKIEKPFPVDYLVIGNKMNIFINMALNYFKPAIIIVNSHLKHESYLMNEKVELSVPIIFIDEQGAYKAEL